MRRLITASVALLAIGSAAASAADLRMPIKALPPVVVSWTGCYIGVNAGGGYADKNFTDPLAVPAFADLGSHRGTGAVAGGQIGCDYQAGMFVIGVQGMFDGTSIKGNHFSVNFGDDFTTQVKWFGTATARLGVTFLSNGLFYVKGGAAWVRDNFHINDAATGVLEAESNPTRNGWIVGFGGEVLTQDGWSMFMEYNYMGFGTRRTDFASFEAPPIPFSLDIRQNVQTVTLGINYRFGWARPVVAKY